MYSRRLDFQCRASSKGEYFGYSASLEKLIWELGTPHEMPFHLFVGWRPSFLRLSFDTGDELKFKGQILTYMS